MDFMQSFDELLVCVGEWFDKMVIDVSNVKDEVMSNYGFFAFENQFYDHAKPIFRVLC